MNKEARWPSDLAAVTLLVYASAMLSITSRVLHTLHDAEGEIAAQPCSAQLVRADRFDELVARQGACGVATSPSGMPVMVAVVVVVGFATVTMIVSLFSISADVRWKSTVAGFALLTALAIAIIAAAVAAYRSPCTGVCAEVRCGACADFDPAETRTTVLCLLVPVAACYAVFSLVTGLCCVAPVPSSRARSTEV